jgi:uncharacterized membrane protein (UPF0127 family)
VLGRLFVASLLLVACSPASSTQTMGGDDEIVFDGNGASATLSVDVADTDDERAKGLMGVEELPSGRGMAFVWEEPTTTGFWMKDTLIPLSIAFVDGSGTIVTIEDMTPCEADPCRTYGASAPFVMAVEANHGWFETNGIDVGDTAKLRDGAG